MLPSYHHLSLLVAFIRRKEKKRKKMPPKFDIAYVAPTISHEEQKRKLHWSKYHITINTNKRINVENLPRWEWLFDKSLNKAFRNPQNYIIKVKGHTFDKDVSKVSIRFGIEVGKKEGRLHAHVFVEIFHYTILQVNHTLVRETIIKYLGLENIYYNARLMKSRDGGDEYVKRYISKID
jgi:hypothetical protein